MKRTWIVIAIAALVAAVAVAGGNPASAAPAKTKKAKASACVERPQQFSWNFLALGPAPQPNGCAPPIYDGGRYVGQDPDPYIRMQLMRDPSTGYTNNY